MYEMPTIAPSGDCSLATVCPHGSVRAGVQQREPRLLEFLRGRFHRRRVRNVELDTHPAAPAAPPATQEYQGDAARASCSS